MRGLILLFGAVASLCTGCAQRCCDTTLYQSSGRQKAIVAVLPVINNVYEGDLTWDLSREFTDEIRKKVYDSSRMYLLRDGGSEELAKMLNTPNPRSIAADTTKHLGAAQFAVVTEIIEQEENPFGLAHSGPDNPFQKEIGSVLSLALRVRVIDLRQEEPKVVLQEVLDQDFVVARPYMTCDYEKMSWGTEAFRHTPMGMAHSRLVRELVARVEGYIEAVR